MNLVSRHEIVCTDPLNQPEEFIDRFQDHVADLLKVSGDPGMAQVRMDCNANGRGHETGQDGFNDYSFNLYDDCICVHFPLEPLEHLIHSSIDTR